MAKGRAAVAPRTGPSEIFWATVEAVHTSPNTVDVQIAGSSTTVPNLRYDASLTPVEGATVWGHKVGTDYFIAGTLA